MVSKKWFYQLMNGNGDVHGEAKVKCCLILEMPSLNPTDGHKISSAYY